MCVWVCANLRCALYIQMCVFVLVSVCLERPCVVLHCPRCSHASLLWGSAAHRKSIVHVWRNLLARAGSNGNAEGRGSLGAGKLFTPWFRVGVGSLSGEEVTLITSLCLTFIHVVTWLNRKMFTSKKSLTSSISDLLLVERSLMRDWPISGTGPVPKVPSELFRCHDGWG